MARNNSFFLEGKRRHKMDDAVWFRLFAQVIDEDGIIWVDEVAEYNDKPVSQVKQKIDALVDKYKGTENFLNLCTAASHQYFSGKTAVDVQEQERETGKRRRRRNKISDDMAILLHAAQNLPTEEEEETETELASV